MARAESFLTSLVAVVATGAGTVRQIEGRMRLIPYVIRGITTATVLIQGSLDGTNWVTLKSVTADAAGHIEAFPHMRGNVSVWTSGTIHVGFWADEVYGT